MGRTEDMVSSMRLIESMTRPSSSMRMMLE